MSKGIPGGKDEKSALSRALEGGPPWMKYVAMLTGALAAVAGYLTIRNTILANEAIYHSTQAVLFQEQATDTWAQYQADSVKARMIEVTARATTNPDLRNELSAEDAKFRLSQPAAKEKATDLENQRDSELMQSNRLLRERDVLQYASMATQLAIALASVAAMTRRFGLFIVGTCVGILGVGITGYALAVHFLKL